VHRDHGGYAASIRFCAAVVGALAIALSLPSTTHAQTPGENSPDTKIVVKHIVRGIERSPDASYEMQISCTRSNGSDTVPARTGESLKFSLAKDASQTFDKRDFPTLASDDVCIARSLNSNGASTTYLSSMPERADGTRPDPQPGLLDGTGFQSAPTRANGQTITVINTFTGDLLVGLRIEGAPPAILTSQELFVRCDNSDFSRSLQLANGQSAIVIGIPTGSECRVSTPTAGGSVRYEDNSGNPNDAVVTIPGTRPECWDLRNVAADCRAQLTAITAFDGRIDPLATPDSKEPTTTQPNNEQKPDPAQAQSANAAAPAVEPAPAVAVDATPLFTG
jgi:hypothetical protein